MFFFCPPFLLYDSTRKISYVGFCFLWRSKGALPTEKLGQNDESRDSGRWLDLGGIFVFVVALVLVVELKIIFSSRRNPD